jgi:hypothetical protein
LQTKPTSSLNVTNSSISPDLAILHKEMKFNRRVDGAYLTCFDKNTTDAQISNPRRIFSFAAVPTGPHTFGRFNASVVPSGMKNSLCQAALPYASRPSASKLGAGKARPDKQGTQCLI